MCIISGRWLINKLPSIPDFFITVASIGDISGSIPARIAYHASDQPIRVAFL
jgi:hypothetical protein